MVEAIGSVQGLGDQGIRISEDQRIRVAEDQRAQQVKEEFLALFYKELLKQAFKPSSLGFSDENNSISQVFGPEVLIDKMAREMVKNQSFEQIMPAVQRGLIVR